MAAARNVSPAAEHHALAFGMELRRELADGGGLAGAVDADHEDHERLAAADRERLRHRRHDLLDLGAPAPAFTSREIVVAALAHHGRDARRDVDAEIGADQRLLDLLDALAASAARA